MINKIFNKFKNNISIYKSDLESKGLYWSLIHRIYKITVLKKILTPLTNFLKPQYLMIENNRFYIDKWDDVISQELILSNRWEDYQTTLFKQNIKKGDVVIDIGAHIGYYTLIAANIVGKKGKVYAFEPDLKNFNILVKNIKVNKFKNIIPINKAVAEKNGKLDLFINPTNTGDHRIYQSKDKRKTMKINVITLNNMLRNEKVDLIKMDIQGSELVALKGASYILAKNKNIKIITEFWPGGLNLSGGSPKEFLQLLRSSKFTLYNIDEEKNRLSVITDKKLLSVYQASEDAFTNLLCIR